LSGPSRRPSQPKKDKIAQLAGLVTKGEEDVSNLLAGKMTKQQEEKKAEQGQRGKAKAKGKERTGKKAVPNAKE